MEQPPHSTEMAVLGAVELMSMIALVGGVMALLMSHGTIGVCMIWCGGVGHVAFRVEMNRLIKRINEEAK